MAKPKSDADAPANEVYSRLIEVAAQHFAEDGFKGASQRAIQRDAGVNPAAAHYYFGSKEAMYKAVVNTFIHGIQEERIRRHAMLPADLKGKARLTRLLQDYFEPTIAIAETPSGRNYARILAHNSESSSSMDIFEEAASSVRNLYLVTLATLFPKADRAELKEVLVMGVGLMAATAASQPSPIMLTTARTAERLAIFVAAGFEALFGPAVE